jgi:hypothetical protein
VQNLLCHRFQHANTPEGLQKVPQRLVLQPKVSEIGLEKTSQECLWTGSGVEGEAGCHARNHA